MNDLSAASYGNGFLDLAASAADKKIYFWRYRRGVWSAPTVVATGVISAPILLRTGAGQLELLGVETDHHLRRWRFVNNAWQTPLSVAHSFSIDDKKFSPISASSWGDGTVDLAVVELNTAKIFHRRIGPGNEICTMPFGCPPPRSFQPISGTALEAPVLTAFSPTSLNVLAMQGLRWHSSWAKAAPFQPVPPPMDPVINWSMFEYIGGDEMIVGGTADTGRSNFSAVAVKEGKLYINRNQNGRWTGFQPIIGQQSAQVFLSPVFLPSIASHGE